MKRGDVLNLTNGITVGGTNGLKMRVTFEKGKGVAVLVLGAMQPDGSLLDAAEALGKLGWVRATPVGSATNTAALSKALRNKAQALSETQDPDLPRNDEMADAEEILRVLARIVEGQTIAKAFGAPGDWGYGTPIGDALAGKVSA